MTTPGPNFRRRRRLAALLVGLLLLAGLGVGAWMLVWESGLADVEAVEVTGAVTVSDDDVRAAAAVPTGGPLAAADTAGIERRVLAVVGIATAAVGRVWPHTVTIAVTERVPVAVAATPDGPFLVDTTGLAYRPAPPDTPLPRLAFGTVAPGDEATTAAVATLAVLPDALRSAVLSVDVDTAGGTAQVLLGLSEDRQVRWGTADRGREKAAVLAALLTEPGRVYDVASPELPTVRR